MFRIEGPVKFRDRRSIDQKIPKDSETVDQRKMEKIEKKRDLPEDGEQRLSLGPYPVDQ